MRHKTVSGWNDGVAVRRKEGFSLPQVVRRPAQLVVIQPCGITDGNSCGVLSPLPPELQPLIGEQRREAVRAHREHAFPGEMRAQILRADASGREDLLRRHADVHAAQLFGKLLRRIQRAVRQQDKRHAGFLNRFHKAFGLRNRAFSPVQGSIQINQKTFHYPLTAPIIREFDAWVVRLYRLHKPLPTKICLPHYTTGRAPFPAVFPGGRAAENAQGPRRCFRAEGLSFY